MNYPCPECGAPSKATQTHKDRDGTPVRWRKCDAGHGFIVRGGPAVIRKPRVPKREPITYTGQILTQWRPEPDWRPV